MFFLPSLNETPTNTLTILSTMLQIPFIRCFGSNILETQELIIPSDGYLLTLFWQKHTPLKHQKEIYVPPAAKKSEWPCE